MHPKTLILLLLLALAWPAASQQTPTVVGDDGEVRSLLLALDRQEKYLQTKGAASLRLGSRRVTKAHALATVRELRKLVLAKHGRADFGAELARRFEIVRVADDALFTAYHSPLLRVSRQRSTAYPVPILGRPADIVARKGKVYRRVAGKLTSAPTRAEITDGAYDPARHAVAWTENSVSYYYAQIQGSAMALFPDGTRRTLLYNGNNGHPYVSVENDILKAVPAAQRPGGYLGLRRYMRAHPEVAERFFRRNPRYIFFKLSDRPPAGMANSPLTAKRSIATDKRYYSAGLVGLVTFPEPRHTPTGVAKRNVRYIVADVDTGAAIKGPSRVDIYFGEGSVEQLFAAGLKDKGTLSYLLLRR